MGQQAIRILQPISHMSFESAESLLPTANLLPITSQRSDCLPVSQCISDGRRVIDDFSISEFKLTRAATIGRLLVLVRNTYL